MSDPFYGEIMMTGFHWAPVNYSLCQGQLVLISQNAALFSLMHTQFGGDGRSTMGLPDLRGRAPFGWDSYSGRNTGSAQGYEQVTLTDSHTGHRHYLEASQSAATTHLPFIPGATHGGYLAESSQPVYASGGSTAQIATSHINSVGDGQPHDNMQPYLAINFCIAMTGIYPQRN